MQLHKEAQRNFRVTDDIEKTALQLIKQGLSDEEIADVIEHMKTEE